MGRSVMRVLVALVLAVTGLSAPATARPLPPPPEKVAKPIVGSVDVSYVPGVGATVVPGGDIAAGFTCTTDRTPTATGVRCDQDAGSGYVYDCSAVDIDAVGLFVATKVPALRADALCSDGSTGYLAQLDTAQGTHEHIDFSTLHTVHVECAVHHAEAGEVPWHVRCSYLLTDRQPIAGGVVMTQAEAGDAIQWSTWGVLSTSDWKCDLVIPNVLAGPSYVDCNTSATNRIQWYCDRVWLTAIATPPVSGSPVPQVRAQSSCDGNENTPVTPHTPGLSHGTYDVPTAAGVPTDTYVTPVIDYDTDRFICQAWGPLNTHVPVPGWTVKCDEP